MANEHMRVGIVCLLWVSVISTALAQDAPHPVRHDIAQAGTEFLVLRHQRLKPGTHDIYLRASQEGVWPFYEKLGNRNVGQWQVIFPHGRKPAGDDEGYRLARYRSFNHWAATRRAVELGGNGPDWKAAREALEIRRSVTTGSDGAVFLEGEMAPGTPYYFAPLPESYRKGSYNSPADSTVRPVRHDRYKPGQEIVTLRHFKIRKGTFGQVKHLSQSSIWPYFEKMGVRIVGQWLRVHPLPGVVDGLESGDWPAANSDYDEAYMMARYVSYEHWQATRPAVMAALGGDGPAYEACVEALRRRGAMTLESSVRFLQGHWRGNPPIYSPGLDERYELE
jgi:hypothetical protein